MTADATQSAPVPTDADFLKCLRAGATRLPRSPDQAAPTFRKLADRCARDTGLSGKDVKFLLEDFRSLAATHQQLARLQREWTDRLRTATTGRDRPRICMLISDGQAARTFLLTDVCRKLVGWADLFVLSPLDLEAEVATLGSGATFLPIPMIRRLRFDTLAGYLGYQQSGSPTAERFVQRLEESYQEAVTQGDSLKGSLRVWQIARGQQGIGSYNRIYGWSLSLFAHMHALKDVGRMLRSLEPDLVFNTSTVSWPSRLMTRAAALEGIPVVANVISWDNMSTKTLIDEVVSSYLVWSEEMDEDFRVSLPFLREKPRRIVGSPQFEPIVQGKGLLPRAEFAARYGLDPGKKLILYTTGSRTLFPREPECLDAVLAHWRDNLRDHADIMVRMHPKGRQGRYEAVLQKFPDVPFTLAGEALQNDDEWVPTRDDIALLVNQLHYCDVIVNVASTMTLEGFAIDKPSINIGFTLGPSVSARYPMEDYYRSRHYREIVETGAARLAHDYQDLFAAIDDVLERKDFDVPKQRSVLRMKCSHIDDSSDRISRFLQGFVANAPRKSSSLQRLSAYAFRLVRPRRTSRHAEN